MNEAIKVVEVEQVGDHAIVVIFSDGKRGLYSAALLASITEVSQRHVTFPDLLPDPLTDKFWIGERLPSEN